MIARHDSARTKRKRDKVEEIGIGAAEGTHHHKLMMLYGVFEVYIPQIIRCWTTKGISTRTMLKPTLKKSVNKKQKKALLRKFGEVVDANQRTSSVNKVYDFVDKFGKVMWEIVIVIEDLGRTCQAEGCGAELCIHSGEKCSNQFGCAVNAMIRHWAYSATIGVTSGVWIEILKVVTALLNNKEMVDTFIARKGIFEAKLRSMQFDEMAKLLLACDKSIAHIPEKEIPCTITCDHKRYDKHYESFVRQYYQNVSPHGCSFSEEDTSRYKGWYEIHVEFATHLLSPIESFGFCDPTHNSRCVEYMNLTRPFRIGNDMLPCPYTDTECDVKSFSPEECRRYGAFLKDEKELLRRKTLGLRAWLISICYRHSNVGEGTKEERLTQWKQMMKDIENWNKDQDSKDYRDAKILNPFSAI